MTEADAVQSVRDLAAEKRCELGELVFAALVKPAPAEVITSIGGRINFENSDLRDAKVGQWMVAFHAPLHLMGFDTERLFEVNDVTGETIWTNEPAPSLWKRIGHWLKGRPTQELHANRKLAKK
jgi:hypothetical protein